MVWDSISQLILPDIFNNIEATFICQPYIRNGDQGSPDSIESGRALISRDKSSDSCQGASIQCNTNEISSDFIGMCLVPIYVNVNSNFILIYSLIYSLLHNRNQGTFIDEDLLSYLGSNFDETDLAVKTLTG